MENLMDLNKYKQFAKYLAIVMNFFFWVTLLLSILTAIGGTVLLFLRDDLFEMTSNQAPFSLSFDNLLRLSVSPQENIIVNTKSIYISITYMTSVLALTLAPICRQIALILATIKTDNPFSVENVRRLNIIGIVLILGSFITRMAEALVATRIINSFQLEQIKVNYGVDVNMTLIGLLIIILAGVFKYGCGLQHEYNSTI